MLGVLHERLGEESAAADGLHEAAHEARLVAEETQVHAGVTEPREEPAERARGLLGIGRVGDGVEDRLGEPRVGLAAARAEHGVGTAREIKEITRDVAPPLHRFERVRRFGRGGGQGELGDAAEGGLERRGVTVVERGEGLGPAGGRGRAVGHERVETLLHAAEVFFQVGLESFG